MFGSFTRSQPMCARPCQRPNCAPDRVADDRHPALVHHVRRLVDHRSAGRSYRCGRGVAVGGRQIDVPPERRRVRSPGSAPARRPGGRRSTAGGVAAVLRRDRRRTPSRTARRRTPSPGPGPGCPGRSRSAFRPAGSRSRHSWSSCTRAPSMSVDGGQRPRRTAPGRGPRRPPAASRSPAVSRPAIVRRSAAVKVPNVRRTSGSRSMNSLGPGSPTQPSSRARSPASWISSSAPSAKKPSTQAAFAAVGAVGQGPLAPAAATSFEHLGVQQQPDDPAQQQPVQVGPVGQLSQGGQPALRAGRRGLSLSTGSRLSTQAQGASRAARGAADLVDPARASPPRCRRPGRRPPAAGRRRSAPPASRSTRRSAAVSVRADVAVALGPGQRRQRLHQVHDVGVQRGPVGQRASSRRARRAGRPAGSARPSGSAPAGCRRGATCSTRAVAAASTVVPQTDASTSCTAYSGRQRDAQVSRNVPWLCDVALAPAATQSRSSSRSRWNSWDRAPVDRLAQVEVAAAGRPAPAAPAGVRQVADQVGLQRHGRHPLVRPSPGPGRPPGAR